MAQASARGPVGALLPMPGIPLSFVPASDAMSVPPPAESSSAPIETAAGSSAAAGSEPDTATLIEQLNQDRLWLLRQIDSGSWAEWRLDLAALERELGQLLDQARERGAS